MLFPYFMFPCNIYIKLGGPLKSCWKDRHLFCVIWHLKFYRSKYIMSSTGLFPHPTDRPLQLLGIPALPLRHDFITSNGVTYPITHPYKVWRKRNLLFHGNLLQRKWFSRSPAAEQFFVRNEKEIIFFLVFRFSDKLIMKGRNGDVINLFHFYLSSRKVEFKPIYHFELSLCQEFFNKFYPKGNFRMVFVILVIKVKNCDFV